MNQTLWNTIKSNELSSTGFIYHVSGDMLDNSEFWEDDREEFLRLFEAAVKTKAGREFFLFLVGFSSIDEYLEEVQEKEGFEEPSEDEVWPDFELEEIEEDEL